MIRIDVRKLHEHATTQELTTLVRNLASMYDFMNMTPNLKRMNIGLHDDSFKEVMKVLAAIHKRSNGK